MAQTVNHHLLQCRRPGFDPWVRKIPWRRAWKPTLVLLPGVSHGGRSLHSYSSWGCKELDTTEQLTLMTMEIILDKNQTRVIFLFEFKMGRKAEEKTHNINWFVPGTANKHTAQWWLRKFCKGDERWRWGVWRPATGGDSREPSSKPILSRSFNYTRSCQRTQRRPFYHHLAFEANSVQLSSVAQSCPTLCDCSTPGLHHQLPELAHTPVHWVSDAIPPSHPLSSPSPPAFNLSQLQGLFQWVSSSHQVAKVLEFQLQHQSFQWIFRISFRMDWFHLLAVQGTLKSLLQHHSSKASILWCSAFFYGPALTPIKMKHVGKVNNLAKWVPHELTQNTKASFERGLLLFYASTMNHFSIGLWCATKSGFYTTNSDNQLSGLTKKLQSTSQSQSCIKKVTVTVWWSAASLTHYSFLNPSETITWEAHSANRWDAVKPQRLQPAQSAERPGSPRHARPLATQPTLGRRASSVTFTWPLTSQLPLLQASWQLFAGKTLPQAAGGRKGFPRVRRILKHGFLR